MLRLPRPAAAVLGLALLVPLLVACTENNPSGSPSGDANPGVH